MPDVLPEPCCLVPRGNWDSLTIYSQLDFVTHDDSSWVALTDNIGTEPTFYSAVWMLVAGKGDPGPSLNPRGIWQTSTIYSRLDVVSYQGSSWIALRDSIGRAPAENSFWMLLAERGPGGGSSLTVLDGSAVQNLYVQQSNPGLTIPGMWVELNPDNTPKTVWVETGV